MNVSIYWPRESCRLCEGEDIETIIDFGQMCLSGVFLEKGESVEKAPLELGRCSSCGLVQLLHSYSSSAMYGQTYGYESHLNNSMKEHLTRKARILEQRYLNLKSHPLVVDIASNDGTLLSGYSSKVRTVGIDPLITNFVDYYPKNATKINQFFSSRGFFEYESNEVDLVTSLSVLYDLESPIEFAKDVSTILASGGIWHFEQSYLPLMVDTLSYDTICHEHLTYLRLHDIKKIVESAGLQILDASLNSVNGGSIAVTAIKSDSQITPSPYVEHLLSAEINDGFASNQAIKNFAKRAVSHKADLLQLISEYSLAGYEIVGLGASTKGNVLLQWLGITTDTLSFIGDINPKKLGKECPGSGVPIVTEEDIISSATSKTIVLVLPWHFREGIIRNCEVLLKKDARLLFPLPRIEIVN